MARDILGEYGRDSHQPQAAVATNGGKPKVKEIDYHEPQGPKGIRDGRSPGLHGDTHDCGTQGKH